MMPWDGWFSSLLKEKLGTERYAKLKKFALWSPNDPWDLEQHPRPDTKIPYSREDPSKTIMFRHPSPGNQPNANMPAADKGSYEEDPYNIAHYPVNTRQIGADPANKNPELEMARLDMMDPDDPAVKEAKEKLMAGPGSSPGNKGMFATGKSDFDPTGLRASMSTNQAAVDKVMATKHPLHVPLPDWYYRQDEIIEWYESRGLPIPLGGGGGDYDTRLSQRIAKW